MSIINVDRSNQPLGQPGPPQYAAPGRVMDRYNLDLFDLIKRKFWIINFFVILGVGLGLLYFFKAPKLYQSEARILVDEKNAPSVNTSEELFNTESTIEKYLVTLKSTSILGPAIEAGKFEEMETFQDIEDPLAYLRNNQDALVAKPADTKSNSGIIQLRFQGPNPEECRQILAAVIDSFRGYIKSTTETIGGESAELLKKFHGEMSLELAHVEEQIQSLMASPELLVVEGGNVINPHQMQMSMMMKDLHELTREKNKLKAQIATVQRDADVGKDLDSMIVEMLRESNNTSFGAYVATHDQFLELKVLEQDLLSQYGSDHPELRKVRKQIEMVEKMRMQELSAIRGSGSKVDPETGEVDQQSLVAEFINQASRKMDLLTAEETSLRASIKKEQQESSGVAALVESLNAKKRERERLELACNTILERLNEINAYQKHLWRNLQEIDPPTRADQSAPSLPISLAAGLFLGSLLGLVFAGLKDIAEKTFHSSDEVSELLNSRVIGHVTQFPRIRKNKLNQQFSKVQPEVVTIHDSASQHSESYRAIRTAVFFQAQQSGAKIIQVTSPIPGDGKSTTVSNLAASIAQSGRRVLVIDCDLRKPVQHWLFGLSNDIGLTSVINGEVDPQEAVQVVQPEYLSVVTSGPVPANPAELLTSARYAAILEHFGEQFDFVLIDTPPLLAVTDPSIVSGHVDLCLLVMKIRNGVRTNSVRAREIIDSTGVKLGGVVVNGLKRGDQKTYHYSGPYGYRQYGYTKTAADRRSMARR